MMEGDLHKQPHSTPKEKSRNSHPSQSDSQGSGHGSHTPPAEGGKGSPSYSLDDTGESTRSLLSVLSHSSIQGLAEDLLKDQESRDSSRTPSSRRSSSSSSSSSSSPSSSRSKTRTESNSRTSTTTRSRKSKSATTTSSVSSDKSPPLSPWEQWLIRKTKEERKQLRIKIKKEKEEKLKAEQEKKMKEAKDKIIKAKVNIWVEEKNTKEKQMRKAQMRLQRTQRNIEEEEKKRIAERAKVNFVEWTDKKKTLQKQEAEKKQEEERAKEEEERIRREKAKEAYEAWYQDAVKKPKAVPCSFGHSQGMLKGYHDTATYPIPSFYNPVPWMPIHVPQSSQENAKPAGKAGKKSRGKKSGLMQIQQPLSPPLLFRDRATKEGASAWGRPR